MLSVSKINTRFWQAATMSALLACGLLPGFGLAQDSSGKDSLQILVYGATGRVGSRIVREALDRGHRITAVSRSAAGIEQQHENLIVVRGDIVDPDSAAERLAGHDVVVVSVRGRIGKSREPAETPQRVGAEVLVDVLRGMAEDPPRLIYVGGAGSLEVEPGVLYADRVPKILTLFMRSLRQEIEGHMLTLEYLRTVKDVAWTYISPPSSFGPGERTGAYRIGGDRMLRDEQGESAISMEDFAVALIDEAENAAHVGQRFSVAY